MMKRLLVVLMSLGSCLALAAGCGSDETSEPPAGSGNASGSASALADLGGTVAINGSGGQLFDLYEDVWWGPLEEKTGVSVEDSAPADLTKVKAQVDSGNVSLDLVEVESGGQYLQAIEDGLLEPLNREKLATYMDEFGASIDQLFPESIGTHGTWFGGYATILAFDKREFPDGEPQPDSLDDLWNLDEFPGKRCLSSSAFYNLEIALRADGVAAKDMYPLDVERALAKLGEIKRDVAKFWREGAEPISLVSSGECVMSTVWNGRPFAAREEGIDFLGVAWENGTYHTGWWAIPKGAPHLEQAYAALAYFLTPSVGAASANLTGYANANRDAVDAIEPEAAEFVATTPANLEVLTTQDDQWWLRNGEAAEEQFAEWSGS